MRRILFDAEKCLSCHSCENACAAVHSRAGSFTGAFLAGEKPHSCVRILRNNAGKLSARRCRQCGDPECVRACPVGAMKKDPSDGAVRCEYELCIGCFLCADACPVGAITRLEDEGHPLKCDLCRGKAGGPACAEACPAGALSVIDGEDDEAKQ